ncbi:unnamed protein product [Prunus armeniaca]
MFDNQPNISHLRVFGCVVYVPIVPSQRTKMGPERKLGIYVRFNSPSIIRYLEPLNGDIFTTRFADCYFDETIFPPLGEEKSVPEEQEGKFVPEERRELSWDIPTLSHLDPRIAQCENKVRRIVHLQSIANQMPNAFNDATKVTKSHIPTANAPARIDVHNGQNNVPANDSSIACLKRGRPLEAQVLPEKENVFGETNAPEVVMVPESQEISINYASTNELWNRNEMTIDDIFSFSMATKITKDGDIKPRSTDECTQRQDWSK